MAAGDDIEAPASAGSDAAVPAATPGEYNRNTGPSEALRAIRKDAKDDDSEKSMSRLQRRRQENRSPRRVQAAERTKEAPPPRVNGEDGRKEVPPPRMNAEEGKKEVQAKPREAETAVKVNEGATEEEPAPTQYQKHKKKFCGVLILLLLVVLIIFIISVVRTQESSDSSVNSNANGVGNIDASDDGDEDEPTTSAPFDDPVFPVSTNPTVAPVTPRPTVTPGTPTMAPTTGKPTRKPTGAPSRSPSANPTNIPSLAPTTSPPTMAPTKRPTPVPTINFESRLKEYLGSNFAIDTESESGKQVIDFMLEEAKADDGDGSLELTPKLEQRFALLTMDLGLFGVRDNIFVGDFFKPNGRNLQAESRWGAFNEDECSWRGVTCGENQKVTHIKLGARDLGGSIPTEVGLLSSLVHLDISDNQLEGTLPEQLYDCVNLREIFLYRNRLSGTISNSIRNTWNLTHFHLASNRLTGTIPTEMRSGNKGIFKIRIFNVYDNQMTGTIPANLKLRQMFLFDLGRNKFSGTVPEDIGVDYVRVRHMHLDHNGFSGTIPESFVNAGNGRLESLLLNDNQFTGELPGDHMFTNTMKQFTVQNNQFTGMNKRTCKLEVLAGGEMTEFKSDCDICVCGKNNPACVHCYN